MINPCSRIESMCFRLWKLKNTDYRAYKPSKKDTKGYEKISRILCNYQKELCKKYKLKRYLYRLKREFKKK